MFETVVFPFVPVMQIFCSDIFLLSALHCVADLLEEGVVAIESYVFAVEDERRCAFEAARAGFVEIVFDVVGDFAGVHVGLE